MPSGIFVYHPRTPSPLPEFPSADISSHHRHVPNPYPASSRAMDEFSKNEFWPHPRAAMEAAALSQGRHGRHRSLDMGSRTVSNNPRAVPGQRLQNPKEWDEWEKNKNWPYPASLPAHEVARLRKLAEDQTKAAAAQASSSSSKAPNKPAPSGGAHANANWPHPANTLNHTNANWPYPTNALDFVPQNPAPAPTIAQPAPRTAAQRSQWPPSDLQWSQQPYFATSSSHEDGYWTDPDGRSRSYASRKPQSHEHSSSHVPSSNVFGRLKSAFSSKRKAEQTSPTDPTASHQDSTPRRASKKQNTLQAGQGRQNQGARPSPFRQPPGLKKDLRSVRTRVQINPYLVKGSPTLVFYDLRFSDRYAKKAVPGGLTHLNADDLDMPACEPPLPNVRIYMQELMTWSIDVKPPARAKVQYVTVGDVLYTIYKTMMQQVDGSVWERDRMDMEFQERVHRAFSRRCKAVSKKRNLPITQITQMGLLKVDYLGSRYQFAGLTHAYGAEGGEWFMMESVTPSAD